MFPKWELDEQQACSIDLIALARLRRAGEPGFWNETGTERIQWDKQGCCELTV